MRNHKKEIKEFALSIKSPIFASRKSVKEAYDFAQQLIDTVENADKIAVVTALHVVMNSIADQLERIINEKS